MYDVRPNLIIGFHGCDKKVADDLLISQQKIKKSEKPHDWLGHGMYFWENNYTRALQWAQEKKKKGKIDTPAVVGAILNLGYCLDLLDGRFLPLLQTYYSVMENDYKNLKLKLPENKDIKVDANKDKLLRILDCAVIEFTHQKIREQIILGTEGAKFFDSTRGTFIEGGPIYNGAGIYDKTHIQICVRNPNCIKGFFLPRKEVNFIEIEKSIKKMELAKYSDNPPTSSSPDTTSTSASVS
jgi:hypothetical protein